MNPILAAGGVLWRRDLDGHVRVCLVHRPRYDDWSLPKGKLKKSETPLRAAVREVWEETGIRAAPQSPLPPARYSVNGVPKVVHFWTMRPAPDGMPVPGMAAAVASETATEIASEVDDVRWVETADALAMLTHPHESAVLRAFLRLPPVTGVVVLVRHASAGQRGAWQGPDDARPLDPAGIHRAADLVSQLSLFAPTRIVSASPQRCLRTVASLAELADLPIEIDTVFNEDSDPRAAAARLRDLAQRARSTVVCSHGDLISAAVGLLRGAGRDHPAAKGEGWVLAFSGAAEVAATPLHQADHR